MPSLRELAAALQSSARNASAGIDKAVPRQVLEMASLWRSKRLMPGEYLSYGLSKKGSSAEEAASFVSNRWHWEKHLPRLNDARFAPVLRNKWLFDRYFRGFDFPLPDTPGLFHPAVGHTTDGAHLRTLDQLACEIARLPAGAVLKPVEGGRGSGILVIAAARTNGGSVFFDTVNGESIPGADLLRRHFPAGRGQPLIVQERLENHADLRAISAGAASTVRIVTLRTAEGEVLVPFAAARFGRRGAAVDNHSQGGLVAGIGVESGKLSEARFPGGGQSIWTRTHPDTGGQIDGTTIPHWCSVVAVARRLSGLVPTLRAVGWDILVTPTGPSVIEGNNGWGITMMQGVAGGYLGAQGVTEALISHGVELPLSERT